MQHLIMKFFLSSPWPGRDGSTFPLKTIGTTMTIPCWTQRYDDTLVSGIVDETLKVSFVWTMGLRRFCLKRRNLLLLAAAVYILLVVYSLTNSKGRCRYEMQTVFSDPAFTDYVEGGKCRVDTSTLGRLCNKWNNSSTECANIEAEIPCFILQTPA